MHRNTIYVVSLTYTRTPNKGHNAEYANITSINSIDINILIHICWFNETVIKTEIIRLTFVAMNSSPGIQVYAVNEVLVNMVKGKVYINLYFN